MICYPLSNAEAGRVGGSGRDFPNPFGEMPGVMVPSGTLPPLGGVPGSMPPSPEDDEGADGEAPEIAEAVDEVVD